MKKYPKKDPLDTTRFHVMWGIVAVVLIIGIIYYINSPSSRTVTEPMQTPISPPASTVEITHTATPATNKEISTTNKKETAPVSNNNRR